MFAKVFTLLVWIAIAVNWLVPALLPEDIALGLHYTGLALVAAHVLEVLVFSKRILSNGRPLQDGLLVLLYGYFHAKDLKVS
ncbi:putative membrane protein [Sinobacterium caligoides]|uniref:Putative membrane protein n=1 Tax=Sinobacterium caligoides TaxID=933926 RepID=A0A3N2DQP4_9GAMM|nr:DUF1145 domain-containing protein [Sinobacterium caligoides]ROS01929.1 putative membrane protein [Sinobacterium caligoides]